jgi:hypothetical protein
MPPGLIKISLSSEIGFVLYFSSSGKIAVPLKSIPLLGHIVPSGYNSTSTPKNLFFIEGDLDVIYQPFFSFALDIIFSISSLVKKFSIYHNSLSIYIFFILLSPK